MRRGFCQPKMNHLKLRSFRRIQYKYTLAELGRIFDISAAQACRIRKGENWNDRTDTR